MKPKVSEKCDCMCHDFQKPPHFSDRCDAWCWHCKPSKPKVSEWENTFELLLNYHIPDKEGIPMVMNHVKNLLDQQKQEMVEMVEEHICPLEENHSDKVNRILDDIIKRLEEHEKED